METTIEQIQNFKGKYPKQLWYLFFSEMWERFSFYGMRGMLTYFMINVLVMNEEAANLQYGATQAFVYAFTFIGGMFADKILGFRKSLFWGGILMIIGSVILAIDPKNFFFIGIAFNIIGTGFFKPNISTMVGRLYKDGDDRRDSGFSLFYSGYVISVGGSIQINAHGLSSLNYIVFGEIALFKDWAIGILNVKMFQFPSSAHTNFFIGCITKFALNLRLTTHPKKGEGCQCENIFFHDFSLIDFSYNHLQDFQQSWLQ